MKKNHDELMQIAIDEARKTMNQDIGGPFGALIIDNLSFTVVVLRRSNLI
jgi:tRNA(Arg) A34 adenosine deaminase TadA